MKMLDDDNDFDRVKENKDKNCTVDVKVTEKNRCQNKTNEAIVKDVKDNICKKYEQNKTHEMKNEAESVYVKNTDGKSTERDNDKSIKTEEITKEGNDNIASDKINIEENRHKDNAPTNGVKADTKGKVEKKRKRESDESNVEFDALHRNLNM